MTHKFFAFVAFSLAGVCCAPPPTKAQDHNSSRSNKTASIISPPDSVLPTEETSAVEPKCVEVQITAGEDDPDNRAPGDPIPGLDVKLGKNPGGSSIQTAPTDDDGIARFCKLRFETRGAFVLTAEAEGSNLAISDPVLVVRAPRFIEWTKQPADGHVGLPLRSADGSCPQVRVRSGKIMPGGSNGSSAGVAYRAGDPVHGVDVKLGNSRGGATVASATTDSDGLATFCDLVEQQRGGISYQPWTIDDADESTVTNPLFQSNNMSGVNPLYEGRSPGSNPVYIGPHTFVITFSTQPPSKANNRIDAACPVVTVSRAAGFSAASPYEALPGAPQPDVTVTLTAVPGGVTTTVTTDANGNALVCGALFSDETAAYYLRATAPGAQPAISLPVLFTYEP